MGLDSPTNSSENNLNVTSYNDVIGNYVLLTVWQEFSVPAQECPIQNPTVYGGSETRSHRSSHPWFNI